MFVAILILASYYRLASALDCISPGITYAIKSISSEQFLDGRNEAHNNPLLGYKGENPADIIYLHWQVIKLNDGKYALKSVSSQQYLDGRLDIHDNPLVSDRDPNEIVFLHWTFVETNGHACAVAIRSASSLQYLNGRTDAHNNPLLTHKDTFSTTNPFLQWVFIPLNYKLSAVISNFDFGDEDEIDNLLDNNKQVAFIDSKTIVAEVIGISVHGTYGESIEESFSFGFEETLGVGIETEVSAGIPLVGKATFTVSTNFEFSANQQKTTTNTKDFETGFAFTPQEPGIYEVGMICYVVKDQLLPFTANVLIRATTNDGNDYTGSQIVSLLQFRESDVTITNVGTNHVLATITGSVRASFGVSSLTFSDRVGDIPPAEF